MILTPKETSNEVKELINAKSTQINHESMPINLRKGLHPRCQNYKESID
jgi:hypothetical protein